MIVRLRQGLILCKIFKVCLRAGVLDIVDIICSSASLLLAYCSCLYRLYFRCRLPVVFVYFSVLGVSVLAALSQADAGTKLVRMR